MAGAAIDDSLTTIQSITPSKLLDDEIEAFEERKHAVEAMKKSLGRLIDSLHGTASPPPVFIVIDELDRCRPTYAVKLLEERKHLFDVEGLVFIFGLHGAQLAHSIVGAYDQVRREWVLTSILSSAICAFRRSDAQTHRQTRSRGPAL